MPEIVLWTRYKGCRWETTLRSRILKFKDVYINLESRTIKKGDEELSLTNKEYE